MSGEYNRPSYLDRVAAGPADAPTLIARMISRRSIESAGYSTPCWRSTYSRSHDGYAQIGVGRTMLYVHRLYLELTQGPVDPTHHVDHLCGMRDCFNPDHLEPVTPTENIRRSSRIAAQIARTHCPQGHPYDETNTVVRMNQRGCRTCRNKARPNRYRKERVA